MNTSRLFPVTSFAVHASPHPTDDTASLNNPSTPRYIGSSRSRHEEATDTLKELEVHLHVGLLAAKDTDLQKSTTGVWSIRLRS